MSKVTMTVVFTGSCQYASEGDMDDHLMAVANQAASYASNLQHDDWNRKISPDYDVQEDANLEIEVRITKS